VPVNHWLAILENIMIIKTIKCISLAAGIYLTAYSIATPGDQIFSAFFGGAFIAFFALYDG